MLWQGNIGGGLLDIHYKEQHQKRLYRLATARLRKNNIDTLLRLHLCARATTAKPPRGIGPMGQGGVGPKGCANGVLPSQFRKTGALAKELSQTQAPIQAYKAAAQVRSGVVHA